jgi:hypothetical protein
MNLVNHQSGNFKKLGLIGCKTEMENLKSQDVSGVGPQRKIK